MESASTNAKAMFQALGVLDGALATARAAVLTAHPELLSPGRGGPLELSAADWRGDEVLAYMVALSEAIARYTMTLEMERALLRPRGRAA
jgi:hypothetical protein